MADPRIPRVIASLNLPHEVRQVLVGHAFAHGLDIELVIEAFRAIYRLGFYDGSVEGRAEACLVKLVGKNYEDR